MDGIAFIATCFSLAHVYMADLVNFLLFLASWFLFYRAVIRSVWFCGFLVFGTSYCADDQKKQWTHQPERTKDNSNRISSIVIYIIRKAKSNHGIQERFDDMSAMNPFTPNTVVPQPRFYILASARYALHTPRVQYSTYSIMCENRYNVSALRAGFWLELKLANL